MSAGDAAGSSSDGLLEAELLASLEDEVEVDLLDDKTVQEVLAKQVDLRKYAAEVESGLRSLEGASIKDYIAESESLAGLHTQIRDCDGVLDSLESMLRSFQGDLASISAQIKFLQDESLSMNVKLRNRKAAEEQLNGFVEKLIVSPELVTNICEAEVNESYLDFVLQLNEKVSFAKTDAAAATAAAGDIAPELEKLRLKAVQKVKDFLLLKIGSLKVKKTNIQILQQNVLLKYARLYRFLVEHAPETAAEVKEVYTTTMSATYQRHIKGYLADCMRAGRSRRQVRPLGTEEWSGSRRSRASSRPSRRRRAATRAYKVGERMAVLEQLAEPPLIPAVLQQQSKASLHYEEIFRSVATLLMDTASTEHDFMAEFFGETDAFDHIFGKAIFLVMESLEGILISSWDAIGCLLLVRVNAEQRSSMAERHQPLLASFFQRVQVLAWSRFKSIMEAHVASLTAFAPKPTAEVHPHYVARRYAELVASLRALRTAAVDATLGSILRALRAEVERLLSGKLATLLSSRKHQAAFLVNNYDVVVTVLAERGARGEDSAHFEQLLDTVKAMFVEEQLAADYGRLIAYVKTTEPLLLQGGDASRADLGAMENLLKTFHDGWKAGIEGINRDVLKSFANFKLGMDLLKQVLTQLLLYYTRFLDLVKHAHPGGAPFAQYILSIPTLMAEIKTFSRQV